MKKRKRLDRKKEIKLIYAKITFKANQKSNSQFEIFSFFYEILWHWDTSEQNIRK